MHSKISFSKWRPFRHGLNVVVLDAQYVAYESPIFINPYPQKRAPLLQDMELHLMLFEWLYTAVSNNAICKLYT